MGANKGKWGVNPRKRIKNRGKNGSQYWKIGRGILGQDFLDSQYVASQQGHEVRSWIRRSRLGFHGFPRIHLGFPR